MAPPTLTNGVNPLTWNVPIVNPNGTPTNAFMRLWQEQFATNAKIPDLTTANGVSAALDLLGATKGSILYRSTFLWSALPGATGHDGWLMTWNNTTGLPEWRVPAISAIPAAIYIDGLGVGQMALVDANGQEVLDASGFGIYIPNPPLPIPMLTGITGRVDGSAVPAGQVGERLTSEVLLAGAVTLATGVANTITTLNLTPGLWDCRGMGINLPGAGCNQTVFVCGITLNSAANPATAVGFQGALFYNALPGTDLTLAGSLSGFQANVTVNTTLYLRVISNFTVASQKAYGFLDAVRIA